MAEYKTSMSCATIVGKIDAPTIEALAAAGYDGVETNAWNVSIEQARECRKIAEANGIKIHSLMRGASLTNPDEVEKSIGLLKQGLRVAAAYGASSMLVVPGRVGDPGLKPWDYSVEFDPATCMVTKICEGDNSPYSDYIQAQNDATASVQKNMPRVLSVAAYEGVTIGLENVWNNLWCDPKLYAAFIHSFENVWLKSYFDLGNGVKYANAEDWLKALGKNSIVKLHFKDYLWDPSHKTIGRFVPIGLGSNDWRAIRGILDDIEYNGFVTIEFEETQSTQLSDEQQVRKFKNFFNGNDILEGV